MDCDCWTPIGKSAMGRVDSKGKILWACIYDHFEENGSIQMHIAIDDPKSVSRRAITSVFEYPFCQLGVKKVLGFVNSENHSALTFDLRLGFKVETIIKDVYDGGHLYILSMTQDECRWLRGTEYGKFEKAATAA